jgi:biopolymer transport protein ExbB
MLCLRQIDCRFAQTRTLNLGAFVLWFVLSVLVQAPAFSANPTDFENRLQTAIEQAQRELEAEKARIQKELQARENELQQVRTDCRKLSDEIVELKVAIAQKQGGLRQIRKQRETLWTELTQFEEGRAQIKSLCLDVQAELGELLDVLPTSERRQNQREDLASIEESLDQNAFDIMVPSVFELVKSLLSESRTAAVYTADILDSQGRRQTVRMLRVGQNLFAYHIPGTSRTAIAISDPYQQGGFRWYEGMSEEIQQAIIGAINRMERQEGIYTLPVDVTGTMTAATDLSSKSLEGRFRSGGIVMFPLAIVAVWLAALIVERLFILLCESRHSLQFCEQILELCSGGDFEEAEHLTKKRKGIVSRIIRVCLANREQSPSVLDDAIQEAFLHELPRLERFLPSIRMLSSVAPMLGLLGTVTGIIATFDMITVVGGGKPRLLAGGISEALVTTATGLSIAIPGLLAHSFLSTRIQGLIADAERFAASLSNVLKRKRSGSGSQEDRR